MSDISTAPPPAIHVGRARSSRRRRNSGTKALFLVPALVLFTVVVIIPIAINLFYGFTDWNGFNPSFNVVGLDNFVAMFSDRATGQAALNTLAFTLINSPLQVAIGLALAASLRVGGRFVSTLRVVVIMPIAISGVVLGFLGTIIFDPRNGILQAFEGTPVLGIVAQNWLGDPNLAMASVIAMNLWQWSGYTMLIFLAGMATIPEELYEAARIDGAGAWAQFRAITWPMLAPAATINIVLVTIGGLKIFDLVYVLTGGGPGTATQTIVMRIATQSGFGNVGYSAATNFSLTLAMVVISLGLLWVLRRREARL